MGGLIAFVCLIASSQGSHRGLWINRMETSSERIGQSSQRRYEALNVQGKDRYFFTRRIAILQGSSTLYMSVELRYAARE